jgi:hypothetical protein
LPICGELLRGSLLERTVRHTKDCPKCARGEGHQVFVLTVTYLGGRTRQIVRDAIGAKMTGEGAFSKNYSVIFRAPELTKRQV